MALKVRDIFVSLGFDVDQRTLNDLDRSLVNIQRSVKGMTFLFAGASIALGGFLKVAGDFEQTEIAFETMLGSAEKAKELLDGLKEDARKTPFTLPGILDAGKRLLAMGIKADRLRDTIKILGDVTAGVGIDKLPQLVLAFGQVSAATKLRGQEIRQFTEAGVPLLEELGRTLGKTAGEVQEMTSRGEVSFEDVRQALENLTMGSGRFANLMEKQSKSFLGILSNLKDFIIINAIAIGKELLPQAKAIATELLTLFEVNRKIIKSKMVKFFKDLSVVVGRLFKVAKATIEGILTMAEAFGGLGEVIKTVATAMLIFTGVQILSAIGSITQSIFGLITAMRTLGTVALLTQVKLVAMPILIGAAVIALGLIIEDIVGFFQGKDSITGLIIDAFEKKFPEAFLNTKAGLFAIIETFKIIRDEAKLLFGFLDEFIGPTAIKNIAAGIGGISAKTVIGAPVKGLARTIEEPVKGLAELIQSGFSAIGIEPGMASSRSQNNQIRINAPINVTVPEGTPSAVVGESIKEGIAEAFDGMIRQATRATEPVTEF